MKPRRPNRIATLRKARGLTQAQLAEKVEAHWVTISRLERGELQLNEEWLDLLSNALNCPPNSIINWDVPKSKIYLSGSIKSGSEVKIFDYQDELDLPADPTDDIITSWLRVEDNAGWPFVREGDLLRFFSVDEREARHYVSYICLVFARQTGIGAFGFLENGSLDGQFNIRPFAGKPIENVELDRLRICAEVRFQMPWPTPK